MKNDNVEMHKKEHLPQFILRTKFSRRGALSYIGHLDLMKVIERAVRRAELPILHTQGYNPRPVMVFALPLGVGIDTTGDYVDVAMSVPMEAKEFLSRIAPQLPDGLEFLSSRQIGEPKDSIMSIVTAASYSFEAPGISRYLLELFSKEKIETQKKSKGKIKTVDIRPLLIKPLPTSTPDRADIMVYAGSVKNLRPDVLLAALCENTSYGKESADECIVTRTALYGGEYPDIKELSEVEIIYKQNT